MNKFLFQKFFTRLLLPYTLLFCFICCTLLLQAQSSEWKLKKDKDGIKVYLKEVEGSRLKELRIRTKIKGSLSSLIAVLDDLPKHHEWIYRSKKAELVKSVNENEMYYYSITDFPWPLSDRDVYFHATIHQDSETKVVTARSVGIADFQKKKKGLIRVPMVEVEWKFIPLGNNLVQLEYHLKSDPGGNIPAWLVNLTIDKGPVQSIKKFRQYAQRPEYKKKKYSFIAEL